MQDFNGFKVFISGGNRWYIAFFSHKISCKWTVAQNDVITKEEDITQVWQPVK